MFGATSGLAHYRAEADGRQPDGILPLVDSSAARMCSPRACGGTRSRPSNGVTRTGHGKLIPLTALTREPGMIVREAAASLAE